MLFYIYIQNTINVCLWVGFFKLSMLNSLNPVNIYIYFYFINLKNKILLYLLVWLHYIAEQITEITQLTKLTKFTKITIITDLAKLIKLREMTWFTELQDSVGRSCLKWCTFANYYNEHHNYDPFDFFQN